MVRIPTTPTIVRIRTTQTRVIMMIMILIMISIMITKMIKVIAKVISGTTLVTIMTKMRKIMAMIYNK